MKKIVMSVYILIIVLAFAAIELLFGTSVSPKIATIYALIASLVSIFCFWANNKISLVGLTGVILLYTILTQFGLVIIYYFLGSSFLENYSTYTLRFLESDQLAKAILLGAIAIIIYTISANISLKYESFTYVERNEDKTNNNKILVGVGYLFLIIVLLFYCFYIAIGAFKIGGSYSEFRDNVISTSNIYAYILMLYSMGIIFVVAAGNKKQIKYGLLLYCMSAFILLMTGNKGEVFYSVLACIGVTKYRKFKINKKIFLLFFLIVFVLIPFVTANRETGIANSINNISVNFTDAFTEMGMQIRVSVYVLEEFARGTRELMYGYSYCSPVINIISKIVPLLGLKVTVPLDYNFLTEYAGMGFSQVAESYCNFGIWGILIFYFIIGKTMSQKEKSCMDEYQLAFWGCLTSILINATRNRFAFVLGQTLMIYIVIRLIKHFGNYKKECEQNESITNN